MNAKYWLVLVCVLGAMYASFLLYRKNELQAAAAKAATATSRSKAAATISGSSPQALPPTPVADFVLTDQSGQKFDSASLKGKVWVASFFFTNCPAVCWKMNQMLAAMQQTDPQGETRFVSITCDPANDTPEALDTYAKHFKADPARWTFLTGDMKAIQKIGQESFQVSVVEKDHTDRACIVDRNGQVRGRFRLADPEQVELMKRLLEVVSAEPVTETKPVETPAPAEAAPVEAAEPAKS